MIGKVVGSFLVWIGMVWLWTITIAMWIYKMQYANELILLMLLVSWLGLREIRETIYVVRKYGKRNKKH